MEKVVGYELGVTNTIVVKHYENNELENCETVGYCISAYEEFNLIRTFDVYNKMNGISKMEDLRLQIKNKNIIKKAVLKEKILVNGLQYERLVRVIEIYDGEL